jgi:hypothetical protein
MSDPNEWIKNLIPPEDVEQLQAKSERIVKGHDTFYEMTLMMYEEDMVKTVRTLNRMQDGNKESWIMAINLVLALLSTMEEALADADVDPYEDL